jgi:2-iminoacetate synthase
MTFINQLQKYNWQEINSKIYSCTEQDVLKALNNNQRSLDDFMALISPAAETYLEQMAHLSRNLTKQRFGNTMQLYVPLYLSNFCENNCVYCGFNSGNKIKRKKLELSEVNDEVKAINKLGFKHILLVTGEASKKADFNYFSECFKVIKPYMSQISLEVQPLKQNEYAALSEQGLNSVYLYQETYHQDRYPTYHLKGKKASFENRIDAYERLGRANVHKMGLGILAGLEEWRTDSFFAALHLSYLKKQYWQTKFSMSFPRLRPNAGGFEPNFVMNDKNLAQLIFAYRLLDENLELALSTREAPSFRDNMLELGITSMSAESKTKPGGYANPEEDELEQFQISDERTACQISEMIKSRGYEVVWKDWDGCLQ